MKNQKKTARDKFIFCRIDFSIEMCELFKNEICGREYSDKKRKVIKEEKTGEIGSQKLAIGRDCKTVVSFCFTNIKVKKSVNV